MKTNKVEQCVILMAGKGTRFLPATKAVAKELFPIGNKPILMFHLQEALKSGIKRVALVISKEKESVKNFLKHDENLEKTLKNNGKFEILSELNEIIDNMEISYIYQGDLNGSGGAVYSVKEWANGKPFVVVNGDDFCESIAEHPPVMKQVIDAYEKTGKMIIGAKAFPMEVIPRYSSIIKQKELFDKCFEISGIIEKPKNPPTNLVGLARYVLDSDIFDEILNCQPVNTEYRLTDAIDSLAKKGRVVSYQFYANYYDCGNKLEYLKCLVNFGLKDKEICEEFKNYLKNIKN